VCNWGDLPDELSIVIPISLLYSEPSPSIVPVAVLKSMQEIFTRRAEIFYVKIRSA